jgi:hypothetical protein
VVRDVVNEFWRRQENLTEFSCGRLVSGDVEVRPRGQ